MDKPILLSPAGNYECFTGAINAGADAVYLGGDRFSARAYADNFTVEEICRSIREAHFYGRRVYLTLNTLMKDDELNDAAEYLRPMYDAGLDAVIVQDMGAVSKIHDVFPDLDIHASTQMTVTGEEGVMWLKERGITCVVPARELSIQEIRRIKEKTGMKLECFIHGAMCYCYSGQCLMSSMLGDRSGNRGRCAQPCRMPYDTVIQGEDSERLRVSQFPLSMRDMCTVSILPELIEAGIDYFKIEGRMKSPEYSAGVTAIYRKYIDRYFEKGSAGYSVDEKDMDILRHLYVRSQLQDGYYNRPNGSDMIAGDRPGYTGSDELITADIREKYLGGLQRTNVKATVVMKTGMASEMTISDGVFSGHAEGDTVQKAQHAPVTREAICARLAKSGGTVVEITPDAIDAETDDDIFMPNGAINELRRRAIDSFIENKIDAFGIYRKNTESTESTSRSDNRSITERSCKTGHSGSAGKPGLCVSIMTLEQLKSAVKSKCSEIYIDSDLILSEREEVNRMISADGIEGREYSVMLPYICRTSRNQDRNFLNDIMEITAENPRIQGYVVRNLDELHFIKNTMKESPNCKKIVSDAGMYVFNSISAEYLSDDVDGITLPYELTSHEMEKLLSAAHIGCPGLSSTIIVYSTIPMMVTANCVRKTAGRCLRSRQDNYGTLDDKTGIRDKKGVRFPVYTDCMHCYNVIYNSVPLNLSGHMKEIKKLDVSAYRLDFVYENGSELTRILSAFENAVSGERTDDNYKLKPNAYTTGHFVHGIL